MLPAVLFLAMMGCAVGFGRLPAEVLLLYLVLSGVTYRVYGRDKAAARSGGRRVPEKTLHILALLGGWPGGLWAQRALRHKTRKRSFQAVFWLIVIANVAWLVGRFGL